MRDDAVEGKENPEPEQQHELSCMYSASSKPREKK